MSFVVQLVLADDEHVAYECYASPAATEPVAVGVADIAEVADVIRGEYRRFSTQFPTDGQIEVRYVSRSE